jgi:hypothetical protein
MTTNLKDNSIIFRIQNRNSMPWKFVDPTVRYSRFSKAGKFWAGAGPLLQHINLNSDRYFNDGFVVLAYDANTLQAATNHPYNSVPAKDIYAIRAKLKNRKPDRQILFAIRFNNSTPITYSRFKGWGGTDTTMRMVDLTTVKRFLRRKTRFNHRPATQFNNTSIVVFSVIPDVSIINKVYEQDLYRGEIGFDRKYVDQLLDGLEKVRDFYAYSENYQAPINIPSVWYPDSIKNAQGISYELTTTHHQAKDGLSCIGAVGHVPVFPSAPGANGASDPNAAGTSRCF